MNPEILLKRNAVIIAVLSSVVVLAGILNALTGELIPRFNGLGGDGSILAEIARDLGGTIGEGKIDKYWLSKSLPSIVVGAVFEGFGIAFDDANIVLAFRLLNAACLIAVIVLWVGIADHLEIAPAWKWLGGVLMVLNYPVLKAMYFHPVSQDYLTLAIGTGIFHLYLKGRHWEMLFLSVVGFFCRPTLLYTGLVLFSLPPDVRFSRLGEMRRFVNPWAWLLGAIYLACVLYFWLSQSPLAEAGFTWAGFYKEIKHIPHLGSILTFVFILMVYRSLLAPLRIEAALFRWQRLGVAVIVFVVVNVVTAYVLARPSGADELYFLERLTKDSSSEPLKFLIAHLGYFGPVILLGVLFWGRIAATITASGVGLTALFTLALFHGVDSESRHLIEYFPFLMAMVAKALGEREWEAWKLWVLAAVSVFVSRAWMPFLQGPWQEDPVNFLKFPEQYYFMTWGPFMSQDMYRLQGAVSLALLALAFVLVRRRPASPTNDA